ncbi:MAG: type II secretion system F family protein [Bryobacterales bacterium]|nr:type II secretion system F family protein [Bryobacterales bacterium]
MLAVLMVFAAVLVGTLCVSLLVTRSGKQQDIERMRERLMGTSGPKEKKARRGAPALIKSEDGTETKLALRLLRKFRLMEQLRTLLEQSGLRWDPARMIHGCLALALAGFNLAWYMIPPPYHRLAFAFGPACGALPVLHAARKRRARLRKFEEQFPEALEFVARSMRAGHAFSVSLEMLHREFREPLSGEFRRTFDEQNLGLPLEVALEKLSLRVPLLDVQFFVSAVLLQKRTGGNLSELLDKLAYLIRERFKLRGRIRAISAHGRMTGTALSSIPAGVAAVLFWVNPEYVLFFVNDETGRMMMGAAVGLQLIGYGVIKKIVSIEV